MLKESCLKQRWLVLITTHRRAALCLRLLRDLEREREMFALGHYVQVVVLEDPSDDDYGAVHDWRASRPWIRWERFPGHHGKAEFWAIWHRWLNIAKGSSAGIFLALQDDLRLCHRFFDRVAAAYDEALRAEPHRPMGLVPLRDTGRDDAECWRRMKPKTLSPTLREIGWVDCIWMAGRKSYAALDWGLGAVSQKLDGVSSGVGRQVTTRLARVGGRFFQTQESLVQHGREVESLMHPSRSTPLGTVAWAGGPVNEWKVGIGIATVRHRAHLLGTVLERLAPQADRVVVYADHADARPEIPSNAVWSRRAPGFGDAGKFAGLDPEHGDWDVFLTCDDDLLYPETYVEHMKAAVNETRNAIVGIHGMTFVEPFRDYYRSRNTKHFGTALEQSTWVHALGTGTIAWRPSLFSFSVNDCRCPNAADVWFNLAAQRKGIARRCIARPAEYLRQLDEDESPSASISAAGRAKAGGPLDTRGIATGAVMATLPWELLRAP